MSQQQKRTTRPVKPKTTKAVAVSEPVAPAEVAPAAEPVVVPLPADSATEIKPKTRTQTNKAIGISISVARVRRHLDKLNINANVDALIADIKTKLASYEYAKSILAGVVSETTATEFSAPLLTTEEATKIVAEVGPLVEELTLQTNALVKERTRFSNEVSIALAVICDDLVKQLIAHAMHRALLAKKKIIQINHLHEEGVENISLYPLVKDLPSFSATAEKITLAAAREQEAAALSAALNIAEKEFKKKYSVQNKKKKAVAETTAAVPVAETTTAEVPLPPVIESSLPVEEAACEDDDLKISFKFYVQQVADCLKQDEKYKSIRVSTDIKQYLSDIIVELIKRLSGLVLLTAASMKNKTVNDSAVLRTVELLLVDGHNAVESVDFKTEQVVDPAALKAEQLKRDAEKEAGREYKFDVETLPKVRILICTRKVTYPDSGFEALSALVTEKLKLYESLSKPEL